MDTKDTIMVPSDCSINQRYYYPNKHFDDQVVLLAFDNLQKRTEDSGHVKVITFFQIL